MIFFLNSQLTRDRESWALQNFDGIKNPSHFGRGIGTTQEWMGVHMLRLHHHLTTVFNVTAVSGQSQNCLVLFKQALVGL